METGMNTMEQTTQAENMGNESEVQGTSGKEQKLFTQEEVNDFMQSRITRMKAQAAKEAQAEYEQKFAELEARSAKLMVKDRLSDRGMPRELADIITCTDENDLDSKLDALQKIYGKQKAGLQEPEEPEAGFRPLRMGAEDSSQQGLQAGGNPVRKAMGLE